MSYTFHTRVSPDRIEVAEGGKWVATFTPRCYTVTLAGPDRTFSETFRADGKTHEVSVTHSKWVRAAPGSDGRQGRRALALPRARRQLVRHARRAGHRDAVRQGRQAV